MEKHLLDPERLRKIPPQFSWIDQRLVSERHIEGLSHAADALYLFLVTVADARGLSFYSERAIGRYLAMAADRLDHARTELLRAELIAYRCPSIRCSRSMGRGYLRHAAPGSLRSKKSSNR
jgi:hypothetical protein